MRIHRTLSVVVLLLAGCSGESNPTGTNGPVPATQVYKSKSSGITQRRGEIVSRQSRWVEVWDEITAGLSPTPAIPAVNFDDVILVFAAGGELADSCTDVRIESVTRIDGALAISVLEERRTGCACPPIVIRPVHVVSVPRAASGASFTFRIATASGCQ